MSIAGRWPHSSRQQEKLTACLQSITEATGRGRSNAGRVPAQIRKSQEGRRERGQAETHTNEPVVQRNAVIEFPLDSGRTDVFEELRNGSGLSCRPDLGMTLHRMRYIEQASSPTLRVRYAL